MSKIIDQTDKTFFKKIFSLKKKLNAKNNIIILIKPRFLSKLISLSNAIKELKIKYKYNISKYLTEEDFKNEKFLFEIINNRKEKSINRIFISDIDDPAIIEIGSKENSTKK
tara:strand:+ start:616 stop:951 length:336 start_codon:yes stop_codon:yes gene_type:complete